jgi:hypothetical protein
MVIVFGFSYAASLAQCMAFCVFSVPCGWANPMLRRLCEKACPLEPKMKSLKCRE